MAVHFLLQAARFRWRSKGASRLTSHWLTRHPPPVNPQSESVTGKIYPPLRVLVSCLSARTLLVSQSRSAPWPDGRVGEGSVGYRDFRHTSEAGQAAGYREFGHGTRSRGTASAFGLPSLRELAPERYRDPRHESRAARLPGFHARTSLRASIPSDNRPQSLNAALPGFETRTAAACARSVPGFRARTGAEATGIRGTEIPGTGARMYREPGHGRGGRYRDSEHGTTGQAPEIAPDSQDQLLVSKLTTQHNNWVRCCSFARKGA